MMPAFLRWLRSQWFLTGIGIVLVSALIWILGPLWDPLAEVLPRLLLIGLAASIWLVLNLWADARKRRRDSALIRGVSGEDIAAENASAEVAGLQNKLARAMALLRKARGTRGYLYEQPWYVIIGPPGAGKTTALLNANLNFPVAEALGSHEVGGVGPTRLCDWYFTDQAVLIDTAGRYTTQDSDAAIDRAGWQAFLGLLKRTRSRQPLNGVMVAMSLEDIARGHPVERMDHARAVRRRLKELRDAFGIQLPVYMIFTKADLIAGFSEYFDDLNRDARSQVWGATFPLAGVSHSPAAVFDAELKALVQRLTGRMTDRLQDERNLERRTAILGFPSQVASLVAPVGEFLEVAFGSSQLDPAAFLRGVYFASGTQEGTPIDRMVGALARGFGIDPGRSEVLRPREGRSYFLEGLLKHLIFREAMLASRNPSERRRRRLLRILTWGGAGAALAAGIALMVVGWTSNAQALARFDAARDQWWRTAQATSLQTVAGPDLYPVVPLLDQARGLPFGPGSPDAVGISFGFSQQRTLHDAAARVYRRALERIMLPRLTLRAEQQMQGLLRARDTARLYQVTRIYMMLGSLGPMDAQMVHDWAAEDWAQQLYPGAAQAPLREALVGHLDALIARPLPPVQIDGGLVTEAQLAFSSISPAQRVYTLLRSTANTVKPFVPADVEAAQGGRWFTRTPPATLSDPIPGLFTPAGFWTGVVPALPETIARIGRESWVLGPQARNDLTHPGSLPAVEREVLSLYTREYIAVWTNFLRSLNVAVSPVQDQQIADLWLLSRPQSPLRGMLVALLANLTLTQPPAQPAALPNAPAGAHPAAGATTAGGNRIEAEAAKPVDDAFRPLRDFTQRELDPVLQGLEELSHQLEQASGGSAMPGGDAARRLLALVRDRPEPIQRWITALATAGQSVRGDIQRRTLLAAYNGDGTGAASPGGAPPPGPLCHSIERRYPFGEGPDAAIEDFVRLFAPNGAMDQFFTKQLRSFVADQGGAWRPVAFMGVQPPVGPSDIAAFQRVDQIRQAFFSFGSLPRVSFLVQPVSADAKTKTATLELGGQPITWDAASTTPPRMFEWPGPGGMTTARVVFDPPAFSSGLSASGPWALFRLLAKGQRRGSDDHFQIAFAQDDRRVMFDVQTGSANAFAPGLLKGFRCPSIGP